MVLKGIGSSANNAGYPDLVLGLDEDDDLLQVKKFFSFLIAKS